MQRADKQDIRNPRAWLTTVCTRRAVDLATAADRTRVDYVGTWLPEFVHTNTGDDLGEQAALASSVSTAFLLLLERLTPRERAAYVLHEIFDFDYAAIAATLGMQEPACRQLVTRARRNVGQPRRRHLTPRARQEELLEAFRSALAGDSMDRLARLLAHDVELHADSGGKAAAPREPLVGRDRVLAFLEMVVVSHSRRHSSRVAEINAMPGLELFGNGRISAAFSFDFAEDGQVRAVFVLRNPDKLAGLLLAAPSLN
jgi:DNA-directed RNA polymerase specialized sigma24 family protein